MIQELLAGLFAVTTLMAPTTMNNTMLPAHPDAQTEAITATAVMKLPEIEVKQTTSPKKSYALTVNFSGLPGSISDLVATADYVVDNVECVPPQKISGARLRPEHSQKLTLQRVDNNRFATMIHADALQDEDYFGLGVCHWALNWATIRFQSQTTKFVGAISIDQIQAGSPVEQHYLASDFGKKPEPAVAVFGEETDIFRAEAGPRFILTLTPSEAGK
jgi:hypothetical protein